MVDHEEANMTGDMVSVKESALDINCIERAMEIIQIWIDDNGIGSLVAEDLADGSAQCVNRSGEDAILVLKRILVGRVDEFALLIRDCRT